MVEKIFIASIIFASWIYIIYGTDKETREFKKYLRKKMEELEKDIAEKERKIKELEDYLSSGK